MPNQACASAAQPPRRPAVAAVAEEDEAGSSSLAWLPDRGSNLWTCEVYGDEKARAQPGKDLLGAASPIPPLPRQRVPAADTPITESLPGAGCLASASRWF